MATGRINIEVKYPPWFLPWVDFLHSQPPWYHMRHIYPQTIVFHWRPAGTQTWREMKGMLVSPWRVE